MAAPGLGRNSSVAWALEPTWGDPVTPPTKWAELYNEAIKAISASEARAVARGLSMREGSLFTARQGAAGSFLVDNNFEGMLRLIEHLFGDSSVGSVEDETGRTTHTATRQDTIMSGKGLTLYIDTDVDAALPVRQYSGWKMDGCRITVDAQRHTQLEWRGAGKDLPVDVARLTPTFPSELLYSDGQEIVIEIDDVARSFDTVQIDIANGLNLDRRVMGSKLIDEPVRGSDPHAFQVTGTIVGDAVLADLTKFRAGTLFKLEVIHTGPVLLAGNYMSTIELLKCEVTDDPYNVAGPDIIKSTIPFRAVEPTSGEMIKWITTNSEVAVA